jgi:hypothetical protein
MIRLAHLAVLVAGGWQLGELALVGWRRLVDQVLDEATRDLGQGGQP